MRIPKVAHLPRAEVLNRSRQVALVLCGVVAAVSLTGAGVVGFDLWGSGLYAGKAQQALTSQLQADMPVTAPESSAPTAAAPASAPASATGPAPAPGILADSATTTPGSAVGRIVIPKIGVDATFVYGTDVAQLAKGPGLWKWGVAPGQPGNAMIAAHRTTYGAWFHNIDKLTVGDQIVVEMPNQPRAVYEVRATQVVDAHDVAITNQTPGVRLTLSACHPLGSDRQRIVVQAELVEGANVQYALPATRWAFQG